MNIGFIGLGSMGIHMATNLIRKNNNLIVYDINDKSTELICDLGATKANSPREVCIQANLIFTSLPNPKVLEEVALGEGGIINNCQLGSTLFDLSTTDPNTIEKIAEAGKSKKINILDAPVSGGTNGAKNATLCIMVGGDKLIFEKYKYILDILGNQVMYCGPIGAGSICKIANNLIGMSLVVILAEAFSLGVKCGVDPSILYKAISMSSGNSTQMAKYPNTVFKGDFSPGFKLELGAKDVSLATQLGREKNIPLDISNLIHQKYVEAMNKGLSKESNLAITKIQEEKSGITIRSDK